MKDWYLRQTPRDRIIVVVVGALSVIGMFYAFVWHPISTGLDDNKTILNSKQQTLQKVRVASAQLQAMGNGGVQLKSDGGKPPYILIDEIVRKAGLNRPDRVEPSGANGARVQFGEVSFDKLVVVLAELELYGLNVKTMNISRKNQGTVSARFNMEKS